MDIINTAFLWVHIAAGFIGLSVYWIPIFSRKGGANHRRYGKIFVNAGYIVVGAAILSIGMRAVRTIMADIPFEEAANFWGFAIFLTYLSLIAFIMLRFGTLVLTEKKDPTRLANTANMALGGGAIIGSIAVIAYALIVKPPLMIVLLSLSPIGLLTGPQIIGYFKGRETSKRAWWYTHMGTMIGAGIAFHTAFFVFGATRLFDLGIKGPYAFIPWILPTLIGVPANIIWERYYRKKFNDPKPGRKAIAQEDIA
ncbi:MAG: hypothetical protein HWE25_06555 [Alphaproteobacteria bacterium]|nr:hypothetical protein [Alphaproteobacteria bacterium]